MYVIACVVVGMLLATVRGKPLISAASIGVLAAPFASAAMAAVL